jgi:TonB family protein
MANWSRQTKLSLLVLAWLSTASVSYAQEAASAPTAAASPLTRPIWIRRATPEDLDNVYPLAARQGRTKGEATIRCDVLATGSLTACEVTHEKPVGSGFGEAALKVMPKFKMKAVANDDRPVAGRTVVIPIRFPVPPLDLNEAVSCYGQLHRRNARVPDDKIMILLETRAKAVALDLALASGTSKPKALKRLGSVEEAAPTNDIAFSRCLDLM